MVSNDDSMVSNDADGSLISCLYFVCMFIYNIYIISKNHEDAGCERMKAKGKEVVHIPCTAKKKLTPTLN